LAVEKTSQVFVGYLLVVCCGWTGQVVNVLREERMTKISNAYRPHLTSHITLPSRHRAGVTLFVTTRSPAYDKLLHSSSSMTVA